MKLSRRMVVSVLFIVLSLLFGMYFWPFILNEIIAPIALTAWLFLRIFVLSIDQHYYWGAIIFAAAVILIRLLVNNKAKVPPEETPDENDTIRTIHYWRSQFAMIDPGVYEDKALKRELIHLVASLYASKQRASPNFFIYEALQRGEMPLPEHIHAFLFSEEPKKAKRSVKERLHSIRETPRKWIRRSTGQDTKEYHRMIDEIISFMETSLEVNNDDGKFTPNKH
jgi:hypothetical protein